MSEEPIDELYKKAQERIIDCALRIQAGLKAAKVDDRTFTCGAPVVLANILARNTQIDVDDFLATFTYVTKVFYHAYLEK